MSLFLEVKNLSAEYNKNSALSGVSFSIDEGDSLAVIGPNGAGKTTLLKSLLGSINYEGEIIWHKKPRIGYVPQRFDFDRTIPLTVMEFFLLSKSDKDFWIPSKQALSEINQALNHVNAHKLINRRIGELSSGEFQRVLIAHAIFGNPNILFFDEPTTGIDMEGEITIYSLLKHLAKELSLTLVLISHDLNIVFEYANKVVCLNKKMLCSGSPSHILTPEHLSELYGGTVGFYKHDHSHGDYKTGDHKNHHDDHHN